MKNNDIDFIIKSNTLIEAEDKLSPFAQFLLRKMILMFEPNNSPIKKLPYRIAIDEIAELTGRGVEEVHEDVRSASIELVSKAVKIPRPANGWVTLKWLASIVYYTEKDCIEFEFDKKLEPELLKLKKAFIGE